VSSVVEAGKTRGGEVAAAARVHSFQRFLESEALFGVAGGALELEAGGVDGGGAAGAEGGAEKEDSPVVDEQKRREGGQVEGGAQIECRD
jgi:hypothetical protein